MEPRNWTIAFFKLGSLCDKVENNSTEYFNATITKARGKAIIPMLETIKRQAMVRNEKKQKKAERWDGRCTKYVKLVLAELKEHADKCMVSHGSHGNYEVELYDDKFHVDTRKKTCSCFKWKISGIPCEHAYGVMLDAGLASDDHVNECFSTTKQRDCYIDNVKPMRGPDGSIENQRPTAQSGWPRTMFRSAKVISVRLKSRPKSKPTGRSRITTRETLPAVGQATTVHATPRTTKAREPGNKPRGRATLRVPRPMHPSEPGKNVPRPAENHRPNLSVRPRRPTVNPSGHDRSDSAHDPIVRPIVPTDRPNAAVDPKPVLKPISYFQARLNPKPPQKT
ncbi:unnamed protein product [Microthlaspi erraticum]|uniref:SWIM-type domain-containing protein n=1 Tax=Microthlaspi erraticum TaxID=1685480 RepID=A0A6D2L595_9BRAS|nr:unnamed protein product [Microthlaspi erraticum]